MSGYSKHKEKIPTTWTQIPTEKKNLNKSAKETEWDAPLIVFVSLFSLKPAAQFLQGPGHVGMNESSD